jgi:hypothetical protein
MQIDDVVVEIFVVVLPANAIDTSCGLSLELEVTLLELFWCYMV